MDVSVVNSINLERIQNDDDVRTSKRILSNSDLELNFSQVVNRNTEEIRLNQNNEINNNIHNEDDNNNDEDNQDNNNNNQNNDNNSHNNSLIINILMNMMDDNDIDDNDNDNNNNNDNKIPNRKLIKELKNNNFIFIKDYSDQIVDENNISYVSWLKNLYIKINYSYNIEKVKNPIISKHKIETPDFPIYESDPKK